MKLVQSLLSHQGICEANDWSGKKVGQYTVTCTWEFLLNQRRELDPMIVVMSKTGARVWDCPIILIKISGSVVSG